jgi:hypothetical protein
MFEKVFINVKSGQRQGLLIQHASAQVKQNMRSRSDGKMIQPPL